jgi:hypothetical protein
MSCSISRYSFTEVSLDDIGNPFAGLPSLEEGQKNDSLKGVSNPFAGLPSLEEGQKERCFEVHKSPSLGTPLKVTKIKREILLKRSRLEMANRKSMIAAKVSYEVSSPIDGAWGFIGRFPTFAINYGSSKIIW